MTAPRWISEAIDDVSVTVRGGEVFRDIPTIDVSRLPAALAERLPIEAITRAIPDALMDIDVNMKAAVVADIMRLLTDGDPEVVSFTELYQDACRALDDAGAPYAIDAESSPDLAIESTSGELTPRKSVELSHVPAHRATIQLDLAGRIRWLARQRTPNV